MGISDMFAKEDRTELTISQLMAILDDRAKMKAEKNVILKLCGSGKMTAPQIYKLFTEDQEEKINE